MPMTPTRRRFLTTLSLACGNALLRTPYVLAAEGVPETTTVRIVKLPSICVAPQYVADELLGAEGFTEVGYVDAAGSESSAMVGRGEADFTLEFAAQTIQTIEAGAAVTILAGVHVGCYELFAKDEIRSVNDLRGRTGGVQTGGPAPSTYLTSIAAHIGVDPSHDIHWVTGADGSNPLRSSPTARSTPLSPFLRSRRNCAPATSAMFFSTASSTAHGRNISAACSRVTRNTCGSSRSPQNGCCAPYSRRPTSAPASRSGSR